LCLAYVAFNRPRIGHALGLTQPVLTRASLDPSGIELSLDGSESEVHRWDEIIAMERAGKAWRLVGPDGSTVVTIPAGLALPRPSWSDGRTLAEAIVEMRPDRYALRGGRFEPGLDEFALRRPGDPVGRVRVVMHRRVLGLGVILFMLAIGLLFWMLPGQQ